MGHLTSFQILEYLSGDCSCISAWLRKRHLKNCGVCRQKAEDVQRNLEEERRIGEDLKTYQKNSREASETLKMPRG